MRGGDSEVDIVVSRVYNYCETQRFSMLFFLMIRRPPRSTLDRSSAASDVYKRQGFDRTIIKEAEIIQRLQHPGIVRLFLLPRQDRTPVAYARAIEMPGQPFFFAMEYLAGGTLADFLKETKRVSVAEAAALGLGIGRALSLIHISEPTRPY